ncbi:chromate efflux transporter [Lentibacter sp. XHP0401]|jgi:chromate transporter|uniref:chromate efflux transporter n=1 Tax=Lentibacter sp. XHP0401 TaxID=2984334 RepID=UPI0021E79EF9|nr:chromate efflux transporter [Lentibacter sp. XHP0401]MCV2892207.1 chromate efflux transporter [Lentibacter sp. XHP0401]
MLLLHASTWAGPMINHTSRDFYKTFAKIGLLSFGGPAAQIALMHRVLVDERAWLNESQFAGALSFCMLLPGPEAMQLATYAGWRLRGLAGGLAAGLLFVVPGALVIWALAMAYISYGAQPWAVAAFLGIKASVITIVVHALFALASKALNNLASIAIAVVAFLGIFAFGAPYPLILLLAAFAGGLFFSCKNTDKPTPVQPASNPIRTLFIGLVLWVTPLAVLYITDQNFLTELAAYFAQMALLSFGGAYALLGWMTQTIVQDHGWITAPQMIDALGLAETTPGPLILVTQFVSHVAGNAQGGIGMATLAGFITLWMVFTPCFVYIFVGAPYLERLLAMPRLRAALTGITAAVTGVIASLSLWFALSVLWPNGLEQGFANISIPALSLILSGMGLFSLLKGNLFLLLAGNATLGCALGAFSFL